MVLARRQQQADRASRDSIPERMLGRLVGCLRSQSDADAAAAAAALPTIARFASTSSLPADIMSSQLQLQRPASAAAQSVHDTSSPPPAANVFSLTAAACGGDGVCGPMLCLPPSVAFDPMCDADNVWHEPLPDVALDSQRLWLRGLYWSFALYICACIGLLVAHVISFGYQKSLDDASIVSSRQNCSQVYFVSVGNLASLAVAPAILLLTRFIILARDQLRSASCRVLRWRCSSTLRACFKAAYRCAPSCGCCGSATADNAVVRGGSLGTTVAHPSSTISIATVRDRGVDEGEGEIEIEASSASSANQASAATLQSAGVARRRAYRRAGNGESDARDADDAESGSDHDESDDDDDDDDDAGRDARIDGPRQTGCDQAVVWSGNFLLVFAILDVVFFTVWNFVSPFLLATDQSSSCADVARSVFDLQLVTSIFLWAFLAELLLLFIVTRLYSWCTQRLGYCLNEEQVCVCVRPLLMCCTGVYGFTLTLFVGPNSVLF